MSTTIYSKFVESVAKNKDRVALKYRKDGEYVPITYGELGDKVNAVAASMRKLGMRKGDAAVIASYNRPEWAIADLAILKLGGVVVPVYHMPGHLLPAGYFKYVLNDAKVKFIVVEDKEIYAVATQIKSEVPSLEHIVLIESTGVEDPGCVRFDDLLKTEPSAVDEPVDISEDDVATIVYTSGTTGEPKGVMLTHKNIVSNAASAVKRCKFTSDDVVISYLPLGHMFERTCSHFSVLFEGGSIGYAEDLLTVARDAEKVRPTVLLAVPRIIEKAYSIAVERVEGSSPFKRGLVLSAVKNLNEYANRKYKKMSIPLWLSFKKNIYDALVAKKFRSLGGGRIRLIVSGAAPLSRQLAKILYIMGFNIVEGYGLTEASPVVAVSAVEDNIIGTVGRPIDQVEVQIGENSEILVRGPNVMKGYLNKPKETAAAIDQDGWLHTGDQGKFDEHGNLIITGRIKEIIVTASGKNITPTAVESKISGSRFVEHAMVHGDNRKYLVALVVPFQDAIEQFAKANRVAYDSYAHLLGKEAIKDVVKQEISKAMTELASYEQIKAFALITEPFTVANALLTPSLKIRRKKIAEKYVDLIEDMYLGGDICAEDKIVCHF
jgi:long-chain acyl-CoA synthetase